MPCDIQIGVSNMPIYEYECGDCEDRFERKQGFDEEPISVCPKCKGKARRVIHSVPIIFKGSGFYITDHRKSGDTGKQPPPKKSSSTVTPPTPEKSDDAGKQPSSQTSESKEK